MAYSIQFDDVIHDYKTDSDSSKDLYSRKEMNSSLSRTVHAESYVNNIGLFKKFVPIFKKKIYRLVLISKSIHVQNIFY